MSALERWAPWWALLVVPAVFLGGLSLAYALVSLACTTGRHGLVHVAPAGEVLVEIGGVAMSWYCVRRFRILAVPEARRFLAGVSLAVAVLFLVASLMQWYVAASLSPCTG